MNPASSESAVRMCVFGVGHAGLRVMERLAAPGVNLVAVDADQDDLRASNAPVKLLLGQKRTRGLGTGADPGLGATLAEEAAPQLREAVKGSDIVVVLAGLGGGAGTGAGSVIARIARESGALTIGVVVTPFEFEGRRRQDLAAAGLSEFKSYSDTVLVLANHRLSRLIDDNTGLEEVLGVSDEFAAHGVRGLWQLVSRRGVLPLSLPELCQVTRGRHSASAFAFAEAAGEGRAQAVIEKLLHHPLLDGGKLLAGSDEVILSILSGPELSRSEITRITEQFRRSAEQANITLGAACSPEHAGRLAVTVFVSQRETPVEETADEPQPESMPAGLMSSDGEAAPRSASRYVPSAPVLTPERQQPELALQTISKGRFDNAEPTLADGEDIDIPTYIRRNITLVDLPSLS